MLGFNAFAADTDEEAELLATSVQQAFVACAPDGRASCRRPAGFADTLPPRRARSSTRC
jgi:alkanesulfonate monooxygenase SsuD/methylene tetrahydromethanopterin reductase-like flavin-dependent oxidoreductase (luciferase family)